MSDLASQNQVDFANESYRSYEGRLEDTYIEGYTPVSLNAPHSSLEKASTWVGFGLWMAAVAFCGIFIQGLSQAAFGSGSLNITASTSLWVGGIAAVVCAVLGYFLIRNGRKEYKEYRARTGREH